MKKVFAILLTLLFVGGVCAGDFYGSQTCSRATAARDTLVSTTKDTMLIVLTGGGKDRIGYLLSTTDLSSGEDSVLVTIKGCGTAVAKASANWSTLTTQYHTNSPTGATCGLIYLPDNTTYIYKVPYLQVILAQCAGAAATDSLTYLFYWWYEKE